MYKYSYILSLILLLLLMPGCKHESWGTHNGGEIVIPEKGEIYYVLEIQTPALDTPPATRAMSIEDEKNIKDLKVLVFEQDPTFPSDEQAEKFLYRANVLSQEAVPGSTEIKKVKVRLRTDDTKQFRLVFIANYPGPFPSISEGETKSDIFAKMKSEFSSKWSATPGATIPMWGESDLTSITDTSTSFKDFKGVSGPILMTRALARVDVGINFVPELESEELQQPSSIPFKLKSVAVYRTGTSFQIPGKQANLATTPTLPTGFAVNDDNTSLAYELAEAADSYIREIYIPERDAGDANNNVPCLIIGGYYGDTNTTNVTYYRADFIDANSKEYLPILRNFRYRFNITKVSGPGFDTAEQALKSKPENLEIKVTKWNEANVDALVTDGQYMLGVSKDKLTYYKMKEDQTIQIQTDWEEGWKAAVVDPTTTDWITLSVHEGVPNTPGHLKITTSENTTGVERTGKVRITAGRMQWDITVTQNNSARLSIKVFNEDESRELNVIYFGGSADTKKIVVKYEPSNGTCDFNLVSGADFEIEKVAAESSDGRAVYNVSCKALTDPNNDFESVINFVDFKVTDTSNSNVKSELKSVTIAQLEHNAVPYVDSGLTQTFEGNDIDYLLDGLTRKFYIKANTPYKVTITNNSASPLHGGSGRGNLVTEASEDGSGWEYESNGKFDGEAITFTPFDDIENPTQSERFTRLYGKVEYTIESTHPDGPQFPPRKFTILLLSGKVQKEANCYMMKPGHAGILIPVTRINTAHEEYQLNKDDFTNWSAEYELNELVEGNNWYPELIWTDMEPSGSEPINSDGTKAFRIVKKVGEGTTGYIFVLPGKDTSKVGNAVIACKSGDGTILWSWHIWMQSEYPKEVGQWQDRNVGATEAATINNDFNTKTFGLQYQFGRKDPFPHKLNAPVYPAIDASGAQVTFTQVNTKTMRGSIQKPTEMVYDSTVWLKEWDGGSAARRKRVWFSVWGGEINNGTDRDVELHTSKSVFDPCPYGWKVPAFGYESNWDTTTGMFFPFTGYHVDGRTNTFDKENSGAIYGLSTVRDNSHIPKYIVFGSTLMNFYGRATTRVIRCVKNDTSNLPSGTPIEYAEYEDYTIYLP